MIEETRTVYFCSYCKKMYKSKRWCLYHEKICYKNDNNKDYCYDCTHCDEVTIYNEYYGSEVSQNSLFCSAKNVYLLNKKAVLRGYDKKYKEQYENYKSQPMIKNKNDCEHYENESIYKDKVNEAYQYDKLNKKFIVVRKKLEEKEIVLL